MICKTCEVEKDFDAFYQSKNTKSGYRGSCKECTNKQNNKWYKDNKEERQKTIKKWFDNNQGYKEEYGKLYRIRPEVKERVKIASDNWYQENREKALNRQKQARIDNPEYEKSRSRAKNLRRRARVLGAGGDLPGNILLIIKELYGEHCLRCGKQEITLDHVIPLSKGGLNSIENLQPLCKSCNSWKYTQTIDFRQEVKYYAPEE